MRDEYSKASKRLNVFTNFTGFVKGFENTEQLQEKIRSLEQQQKTNIQTQKSMLTILKQKQIIP